MDLFDNGLYNTTVASSESITNVRSRMETPKDGLSDTIAVLLLPMVRCWRFITSETSDKLLFESSDSWTLNVVAVLSSWSDFFYPFIAQRILYIILNSGRVLIEFKHLKKKHPVCYEFLQDNCSLHAVHFVFFKKFERNYLVKMNQIMQPDPHNFKKRQLSNLSV